MGVSFRVVRAAVNTSGTQLFSVSGFGTPKAAIFIVSKATTNATTIDDAVLSIGFTDGTRQFCIASMSDDNIADSNCSHVTSNTTLMTIFNAADNTILESASFNSFVSDGVSVDWNVGSAFTGLCTVILIGGSDVSVYAGDFTASGSVDTGTDVTAVPFLSDNLLLLGSQNAAYDTIDDAVAQVMMSFGIVDRGGSVVQTSSNWTQVDANASSDGRNRVSTIYAACDPDASPAIEIGDIDATGFTATTRIAGGAYKYCYLALAYNGAVSHWVGVITSPTTTGNKAETSPGIKPQFVLQAISGAVAVDVQETSGSTGAGTYGVCAFTASEIFSTTVGDKDAAATMDTESFANNNLTCRSDSKVYLCIATFVSMDATGYTLNYSTVSIIARKWPTWVVGEFVEAAGQPAIRRFGNTRNTRPIEIGRTGCAVQ